MPSRTGVNVMPDTLPKNIFEEYIRVIDKKRHASGITEGISSALNKFEVILLALERALQDLQANEKVDRAIIDQISTDIVKILTEWLDIFQTMSSIKEIRSLRYCLGPLISIVSGIQTNDNDKFIYALRHILKMRNLSATEIWNIYTENKFRYDPSVELSEAHDTDMVSINKRRFSDIDFFAVLEELFAFDDTREMAIWEIELRVGQSRKEAEKYADRYPVVKGKYELGFEGNEECDALELAHLLFTFSSALSSIEDVELSIVSWEDGSKVVNFRLRIRTLTAKFDVIQILEKARKKVVAYYTQNVGDAMDDLDREKRRLLEEAADLKDKHVKAKSLDKQFEHANKSYDLIERELKIEMMKLDIRLKHIEGQEKTSELLKKAFTSNDSDIALTINNMLYHSRHNGQMEQGQDIRFLDVNEKIADDPKSSEDPLA